jgi:3-methylcrotonyl-CoA carboxylase alpha subunit
MPGKVVKVLVEGDAVVKKGQPLVIIEAMKMEHVIAAPRDGTVESVARAVGDVVQEGVVLVSLKA